MKIHLTGMSPRTASPTTRERVTFAGLLDRALNVDGHWVTRAPHTDIPVDFVMVGMASVISPGATYALVGLEAIGRAIEDAVPLLLFVDDPDLGKVKNGASSALRDPQRLYSDYLMSKRIKASRILSERQKASIETAVEMLVGEHWPPVLLPMHAWGVGTEAITAKRLGVDTTVVPLDVTPVLGAAREVINRSSSYRADMWFTERHYSPAMLQQDRVRWPVVPVDSSTMDSPEEVYAAAKGIYQGLAGSCPGWWTPTPLHVAQAGSVYLMSSLDQDLIGPPSPYYLTPDNVEALSDVKHAELAEEQHRYLKENTWSLDQLLHRLEDLIGSTSSFSKPGTKTPTT